MQAQAPRLRHPQCDRLAINDVEGIPAASVAMPGLPSNDAGPEQGLIDSLPSRCTGRADMQARRRAFIVITKARPRIRNEFDAINMAMQFIFITHGDRQCAVKNEYDTDVAPAWGSKLPRPMKHRHLNACRLDGGTENKTAKLEMETIVRNVIFNAPRIAPDNAPACLAIAIDRKAQCMGSQARSAK